MDCIDKVMSLLFNMLSRLVIAFLLRSKRLLISWLQSPSTVILEPKKIKSDTVSIIAPSICHAHQATQLKETKQQQQQNPNFLYLKVSEITKTVRQRNT